MEQPNKSNVTIHKVGKGQYLHRLIPIFDSSGKLIKTVLKPFMVELRFRDVIQIVIGSALLAVPVAFTEESWNLGEILPFFNVLLIGVLSLSFIALFVYFNFYQHYLNKYLFEYIKRVVAVYLISLTVVSIIMTLIGQCPWTSDLALAIKRVIIVTFPASMSASITDSLK